MACINIMVRSFLWTLVNNIYLIRKSAGLDKVVSLHFFNVKT